MSSLQISRTHVHLQYPTDCPPLYAELPHECLRPIGCKPLPIANYIGIPQTWLQSLKYYKVFDSIENVVLLVIIDGPTWG